MKIIIPMAGLGTRLRPHTLITPKPLIRIAGETIVVHLIKEICKTFEGKIEEICYVIGDFGKKVENELLQIAESLNTKGKIYYQKNPLGTAHAIYCAEQSLKGNVIIAFADTLFHANMKIKKDDESIIWVKEVEDPSQYGVVKTEKDYITGFVEKPKKFVSNKAIIGIYYFKKGEKLKAELKRIIDKKLKRNNEYQITDALEKMRLDGGKMRIGIVEKWMDCGNKDTLLYANAELLKIKNNCKKENEKVKGSILNENCYIGKKVKIRNSIIGPDVSIDDDSMIENCIIKNSILQKNIRLKDLVIVNSIIGNNANILGKQKSFNIGDYTTIEI